MQVDDDLAADPVDVVAPLAAQCPRHSRKRARIGLLAIILVGRDIAVLAEGAAHVAGGEEDRARALGAAIEELLAGVMEMRADPRAGGKLAGPGLAACQAVDAAVPGAEIAMGEHAPGERAAEVEQARPVRVGRQRRAFPDRLPALEKDPCQALELSP